MTQYDEWMVIAAQRFFGVHQREHLQRDHDRLIDRCAAYLVGVFGISKGKA